MFTESINSNGDVSQLPGRWIANDKTSSQHGTMHEFESPPVWFAAGSHNAQIGFLTSGNHGTLGGSIDVVRWVK